MIMANALFPLPLTPFEYYYWCDDRPEYPTTFPMELVFRGPLERQPLERALQVCLDRHPLLAAHLDARGGFPQWIAAGDRAVECDWREDGSRVDYLVRRYIDLTQQRGLRIWVRTSSERSRLVLLFHHACCDALGALQFVSDLLVAYDSVCKGEDPSQKLPPLEPERLRMRGDYGLTEAGYRPNLRDAWRTARFWMGRFWSRPAVVAAARSQEVRAEASRDLGYITYYVTREERARLQSRANRAGASVNDLLLAELLVALQEWNQRHQVPGKKIVLNVPVNLRTRSDQRLPAANVLGFWFLERKLPASSDAATLIAGIREEMESVRKWRLPLYFIGGLGYATQFPSLIRRVLRGNRSFATAVLSNSGRALAKLPLEQVDRQWITGGAVLEQITGVPPIRPGTRVSLLVATYAHAMSINLHWDPHALDEPAACALLESVLERLRKTS